MLQFHRTRLGRKFLRRLRRRSATRGLAGELDSEQHGDNSEDFRAERDDMTCAGRGSRFELLVYVCGIAHVIADRSLPVDLQEQLFRLDDGVAEARFQSLRNEQSHLRHLEVVDRAECTARLEPKADDSAGRR